MEFSVIVLIIFIISFLWALISLRGLNTKKMKEITHVKQSLKKGKVIFDRRHSS